MHVGGARSDSGGAFALAASDYKKGVEPQENLGKTAVSQGSTPSNLWAVLDSNQRPLRCQNFPSPTGFSGFSLETRAFYRFRKRLQAFADLRTAYR